MVSLGDYCPNGQDDRVLCCLLLLFVFSALLSGQAGKMPRPKPPPEPVFGEAISFRVIIDVGYETGDRMSSVPMGFRYNLFGDPSTTEVSAQFLWGTTPFSMQTACCVLLRAAADRVECSLHADVTCRVFTITCSCWTPAR